MNYAIFNFKADQLLKIVTFVNVIYLIFKKNKTPIDGFGLPSIRLSRRVKFAREANKGDKKNERSRLGKRACLFSQDLHLQLEVARILVEQTQTSEVVPARARLSASSKT